MNEYKCTFLHDEKDWYYSRAVRGFTPQHAAEGFADYAFHNHDMWEHNPIWEGEDSIVVLGPLNERNVFAIEVEFLPEFRAYKEGA